MCRIIVASLIILFMLFMGNAETHSGSVEPVYAQADHSCGPECLLALIRMTGKDVSKYTSIEDIYDLIGKKVNTPTTLYDIKAAATELGFTAKGYKCTVDHLKRLNGYAILHVRQSDAAVSDLFHFILLKEVQGDTAMVIDSGTLLVKHVLVADLEKVWDGYALVLSPSKGIPLFRLHKSGQKSEDLVSKERFDEIRNFGLVDSGSLLEHSFSISNKTDGPMTLRIVSKSCSCVSAELGCPELGPGCESSLKLRLHVDKPGWSTANVAVEMLPVGVIKRYVAKAYGKDSFQTMPAIGNIEAPDGGVVGYPVQIMYFIDSKNIVTFDHIDSNIPNISVGSTTTKKTEKGEYSAFIFNVTLLYDGGKPTGVVSKYQGELNFVLNTTEGRRFIPFKLSVVSGRPKYRLTPQKVFVIASKSGKPTEKKVKVEFLTETVPRNISIKSGVALPLEIRTTQTSKNAYIISMSAGPKTLQDTPPGMTKGQIAIVPEGVPDPTVLTLPISLFIRE